MPFDPNDERWRELLWQVSVLECENRKLQRRIASQRRRITRLIELARKWRTR